jgi:biopolymer transport protein ExbD
MAAEIQDEDDDEGIAQINVVPFVDIVLVLLIIFLLTSSLIAKASFSVDLPRAASAGQAVEGALNIVLSRSGAVYLNGAEVPLASLHDSIAPMAVSDPALRAVIAADKTLRYEQVIEVIDAVKGAGVTTFALNIERGAPRALP